MSALLRTLTTSPEMDDHTMQPNTMENGNGAPQKTSVNFNTDKTHAFKTIQSSEPDYSDRVIQPRQHPLSPSGKIANATIPTEVPDDEVLCQSCNKKIWYGDYIQNRSGCFHKMCALCWTRGTMKHRNKCPVPSCNASTAICEYFCYETATSELIVNNALGGSLSNNNTVTPSSMRTIGAVSPAPQGKISQGPSPTSSDDELTEGRVHSPNVGEGFTTAGGGGSRGDGELSDDNHSEGAAALLMFATHADDNQSLENRGNVGYDTGDRGGWGMKTPEHIEYVGASSNADHATNWSDTEHSYIQPQKKQKLDRFELEYQNYLKKKSTMMSSSSKSSKKMPLKKHKTHKFGRGSSRFNGVSLKVGKKDPSRTKKYEAKFSQWRLGSYFLEADAALAYDSCVRKSGLTNHYNKINFDSEEEYMQSREAEVKERGFDKETVDLEKTLAHITAKVKAVKA